ncbi:MAG TPA: histidinol dehydrogenase [Spirochaetia bacterium]|nr:histidinol dehydrogenase [Spirochaetia bacterium]
MEIAIEQWDLLTEKQQRRYLARSEAEIADVTAGVQQIVDSVRQRGDEAVRESVLRFDRVDLAGKPLEVQPQETETAVAALDPKVRTAIDYAIQNVRRFHEVQMPRTVALTEVRPGILAGERARPISSAGLYVPRGRGSFPSMLYMLAVPAQVAGVGDVAVVTPPAEDGSVDAACLYAALRCGVHRIYRVGGPQAIAALAYGTREIPPVRKIIGPGSAYVAAAKRIVSSVLDVGLPAGPSESMIIADRDADPYRVAMDLIIEAEHGADSSAILLTSSRPVAEAVATILPELISALPEPRRSFVNAVFSNYGGIFLCSSIEEAADIANQFAPEHLQIQTVNPWDTLSLIENAGEILLGDTTPFSIANYLAGANAVLPTGGKARTYSAVSVRDFIKYSSVVHVTQSGMDEAAEHVIALADYEGFPAHAGALRMRYENR